MGSESRNVRERQRKTLQAQLAAREVLLKERNLSPESTKKDTLIRKIKAKLKETDLRLARIAAQEDLKKKLAQAKEEKLKEPKAKKEKSGKKKDAGKPGGDTKKKGKEKKQ
jgi:hypothetical protein